LVFFLGILEFNPQLAGQDITPANLEFGSVSSRRRERREKSFSDTSALQGKTFKSGLRVGRGGTGLLLKIFRPISWNCILIKYRLKNLFAHLLLRLTSSNVFLFYLVSTEDVSVVKVIISY
jgi:hypothetical protein